MDSTNSVGAILSWQSLLHQNDDLDALHQMCIAVTSKF